MRKYSYLVRKIFLIIIIIMELLVIFCFSAQPANDSYELTGEAISMISSPLKTQEDWNLRSAIIPVVRKLAHVFLYFVLGATIIVIENIEKKMSAVNTRRKILYALCVATLVGALDEIHQIFIPGRGAAFTDVFIDLTGAILGVFFVILIQILWKRRKKHEYRL